MKWTLAAVNVVLLVAFCFLFFRGEGDQKGSFSGLTVYFLCAGFEQDQHMIEWRRGLIQAEKDFGCTIKIWNCGWEQNNFLENFSKAIIWRPDVICVPGYESEAQYKSLMEEALSKGIHVSVYHTALPELQHLHQGDGVGFVGQDEYVDGRKLAVRSVQQFGLDDNSEVLVFGNSRPNADLRLRSEGIMGVLREHEIKYQLIDMSEYWLSVPSRSVDQALSDYLSSHSKPTCILFDSGGVELLMRAFSALGISPGEILVGSFDCTRGGLSALKQNYVQLVTGRNGRNLVYLAALHGCMSAKYGMYGMDVVTPCLFFDKSNIESFEKLFEPEG